MDCWRKTHQRLRPVERFPWLPNITPKGDRKHGTYRPRHTGNDRYSRDEDVLGISRDEAGVEQRSGDLGRCYRDDIQDLACVERLSWVDISLRAVETGSFEDNAPLQWLDGHRLLDSARHCHIHGSPSSRRRSSVPKLPPIHTNSQRCFDICPNISRSPYHCSRDGDVVWTPRLTLAKLDLHDGSDEI